MNVKVHELMVGQVMKVTPSTTLGRVRQVMRGSLNKLLFFAFEKVGAKQWPQQLKRLYEIHSKIEKVYAVKAAFSDPATFVANDVASRIGNANTIADSTKVPLAIPTGNEEQPWITLSTALNRKWFDDLAEQFGTRNIDDFVMKLAEDESLDKVRKELFGSARIGPPPPRLESCRNSGASRPGCV